MRILGIGGSTRRESRSLSALKIALGTAERAGAQTALADVRALDLPLHDDDKAFEDYPSSLRWLLDEVKKADAYILCSPTYHGIISGAVKNVLDLLNYLGGETPPYFGGKVVGLMALGRNSANVLNDLHHCTRGLNGLSAPTTVMVPTNVVDQKAEVITDAAVDKRLARMIEQVMQLTRKLT